MKLNPCFEWLRHPLKAAVFTFLLTKVSIFSLGFIVTFFNEGPSDPLSIVMRQFCRWDSPHYIDIAENWYVNTGEQRFFIVFLPFYPLLIRLLTFNWQYVNLSALLVSNFSSAIAAVYLFKLAKLDFDDDVAARAVFYLSIFPTAYFLCAIYTEGLFLALAIACLYYARLERWPSAGLLGMLASLTRITGLSLLPALLCEYFHQRRFRQLKGLGFKLIWPIFPMFGFTEYLFINYQVTGNFFKFMEYQRVNWYQTFDPLLGLENAWQITVQAAFPDSFMLGAAQLAFAALGLAGILLGFILRLRFSYNAYMFFAWAMSVSTGWWISVPRYILVLFPIFILFGVAGRRKVFNYTVAPVFLVLLCLFTITFSKGSWAF
ncbi:MAG: hypothetical protein QW717_03285 [Candidatus Bathyarchaeia archaeon]